jgi:ADP-ribosyl-[dinitrogen reductase] hydrolase
VVRSGAGDALGGAAGDALGAGYEFGPPLGPDVQVVPKGGGTFDWAPGEWTDDTQMASAILSPLAAGRTGPSLVAAVAAGFLTWYASHPADIGNQTRVALRQAGADPARLAAAAAAAQARNPEAAGNGSLMRTGPVGLTVAGSRAERARLVGAISDLTHPHPDCAAACVLSCDAIHRFRSLPPGPPQPSWIEHVRLGLDLLEDDQRGRWTGLLDTVAEGSPEEFAAKNGWVVDAFRQALGVLQATPVEKGPWASWHLRRSLERAVRGGGDTDTVAAIAGSLAGAAWGATAVPLSWQLLLHGSAVDADGVRTSTGADLARQSRLAANEGRSDAHGWPGGDSMLDHYRRVNPDDPLDLAIDDHLAVGNVHAVDVVEAEVFVSLCRMGPADLANGSQRLEVGLHDSNDPAANPNLCRSSPTSPRSSTRPPRPAGGSSSTASRPSTALRPPSRPSSSGAVCHLTRQPARPRRRRVGTCCRCSAGRWMSWPTPASEVTSPSRPSQAPGTRGNDTSRGVWIGASSLGKRRPW